MKASVPGDQSLINVWMPWFSIIIFWAAVPGMWLARPIFFPDGGLYLSAFFAGAATLFALYYTWNWRKWLNRSWQCIRHGPAKVNILREGIRFARPNGVSQNYDWSDVVNMRANWYDVDELPMPCSRSLVLVLESGHEVHVHSGRDWREAERLLSISGGTLRSKPIFLYDEEIAESSWGLENKKFYIDELLERDKDLLPDQRQH